MKEYKSYKFRLYPTKEQAHQIVNTLGACRFVFNTALDYKQNLYKHNKTTISNFDLCKDFTQIKKLPEYSWLKEIDAHAIQTSLSDLDAAYQNYYLKLKQGKRTSIRFKSRKNPKDSYRTNNVNNTIRVSEDKIRLPKLGWVLFRDSRTIPPEHRIKSATISKNAIGQFFASVLVEYEFEPNLPDIVSNVFSADMSAKEFMVSSEMKFENQKFYRSKERILRIRSRRYSKKCKSSKNQEKSRLRMARVHIDIMNKRRGHQKNLAFELTSRFDALIFEDLNIPEMQQTSGGLSKTVSLDFSWSEFLNQVQWQCRKKNKHFVKIDRWTPSSKLCSECGTLKEDLTLSDRTFRCECGHVEDRDLNAAKNIKRFGLDVLKDSGVNLINLTGMSPESYACGVMTTKPAQENQNHQSFLGRIR